jgi:hypothetical protein
LAGVTASPSLIAWAGKAAVVFLPESSMISVNFKPGVSQSFPLHLHSHIKAAGKSFNGSLGSEFPVTLNCCEQKAS